MAAFGASDRLRYLLPYCLQLVLKTALTVRQPEGGREKQIFSTFALRRVLAQGGLEKHVEMKTETAFACDRSRRLTAVFPHWLFTGCNRAFARGHSHPTARHMHMHAYTLAGDQDCKRGTRLSWFARICLICMLMRSMQSRSE